ncbi:TadE/TadG family type IV pilus assembly protein [Palleronia sp. KMU-117]|uniref:TadE/TadG family type IV pilus assembly protein n=1 Tax=Palleronia sp. KMU-117 TaxID=3434108 RepID=UPI003D727637
MRIRRHIPSALRRFGRDESGLALVEFAICLPLMILVFGMIIEGSRLMWSFQNSISGVRDATRYLARITPADVCQPGGTTFDDQADRLTAIIRDRIGTGESILPRGVDLVDVTATLDCVVGAYRISPAPVAQLTARVEITHPFASLFAFAGGGVEDSVIVDVSDEARIFGL